MGMSQDSPRRIVSLDVGVAMVVTDLHGDWDAYRRYRDRFLALDAEGEADYLIFAGDLIHSEGPPESDRSLDIVLDLLALREGLGERLIYLLGNHELPHLYGIILQKGDHVYTPSFEAALGEHRPAVITLFDSLPFYVRTRAGVSICHAGAAPELREPDAAARVFGYSHRRVLDEVAAVLPSEERDSVRAGFSRWSGEPYEEMACTNLAVSGPDDPRYDDLLVGFVASSHPDFELLWAALFSTNEFDDGMKAYGVSIDALLLHLSAGYHEQKALVAGHIGCRGGHALISDRQLRLASATHAHPPTSGQYLLFDTESPVQRDDLLAGLGSVFK
jgi:predicted phosphodiesterase